MEEQKRDDFVMQMQSPTINKLMAALAKAQAEIRSAELNGTNPHFDAKYAGLDAIWDACRAPLSKYELCVVQAPMEDDKGTAIITTLGHSSGEFIRGKLYITPRDKSSQAIGSAMTYARRYSLAAMAGVAPRGEDDDGEGSMGRKGRAREEKQEPRAAAPANPPAKPDIAPCDKVITEAEAATLIEEAKLRRVDGLQFLAECKRHRAGLTKFTQLPAKAYTAVYEFVLKHEMPPAKSPVEVEIEKLGSLGIPRDQVLIYIKTLPFSATPEVIVKTLNSERVGYKIEVLRKRFSDIAERAKKEGAAA